MRRLLTLSLIAVVAAFVLLIQPPHSASADDRDFVLVNMSGTAFTEVYVSPTGSDDWQDNLMPRGYVLLPGYQVPVHFSRYSPGKCSYDILVVGSAGEQGELYGVDLCSVDTVTFN